MKNKLLIVLLFCLTLCGCGNYRELNDVAIITGVSIDKAEDGTYQVGFLTANSPKQQTSSKEGEAQTTVYSATGDTLSAAAKQIDFKNPKKLYFGHINVVIISEEIGKDGFLEIADWLLRFPETRKQFFLLQAKNTKAENILKIVSPLESFPSQNIAALLENTRDTQSITTAVDYSSFIENVLTAGADPILPAITIYGDVKKGSSGQNIQTTEPNTYLKLEGLALYRDDKFVDYADSEESQSINILNGNAKEIKTVFEYQEEKVSFNAGTVKTKTKLKSPTTIEVNITGQGFISEINSNTALEKTEVIKDLEKALNKKIYKQLNETIKKMQKDFQCDVFAYGNKIYKKYPKEWDKIENKWHEKYFKELKVTVNVDFTISSPGSLEQTMKEVKK